MLIKHGDAEIIDVIKDSDHAIDDEGTKKAMDKVRATATANENNMQDTDKKDN